MAGGDAAQGVIPLELFDQQRDSGTVAVEPPAVQGLQRQIGDEDLVVISAELEERLLVGGLLGVEAPDHDEARRVGPSNGLIAEFGDLDARLGLAYRRWVSLRLMGAMRLATITKQACLASSHSMILRS